MKIIEAHEASKRTSIPLNRDHLASSIQAKKAWRSGAGAAKTKALRLIGATSWDDIESLQATKAQSSHILRRSKTKGPWKPPVEATKAKAPLGPQAGIT